MAAEGFVEMAILQNGARRSICLRFQDSGPGIADIALAMRDGLHLWQGDGPGPGGSKRLVHEFDLQSSPESGTSVTVVRWK